MKPIEEFRRSGGAYCRICINAYQAERRAKDPKAHSAYNTQWGMTNRAKVRDWRIRRMFGLPMGWYDKTLAEQGGGCAICGTTDPSPTVHFHVDHNEGTTDVRGLLCGRCNTGIGSLRHDPKILASAIAYLAKNGTER